MLRKSAERLRCGSAHGGEFQLKEPAEIEGQGQKIEFNPHWAKPVSGSGEPAAVL